MITWLVGVALAASVPVEGTDLVVDVAPGDRFVPPAEGEDIDVVGSYVPDGAEAIPVTWVAGGWVDPSLPLESAQLLDELRRRDPSIAGWTDPPAWDPQLGTLSWAIRTPDGVVGWVARPGRNGVAAARGISEVGAWPAQRTGLRDVASRLGFVSGAAHADGGPPGDGFADVVIAVVAPAPPETWWTSRHPRRLVLLVLFLFGVPVVVEWGRRRGFWWGKRLDPEHVPDVD